MRLSVFLASASLLMLAACGTHAPLKKVEARAPIKISANSNVNPIQVRPVAVNLKFNEQWGETGKGPGCLVQPGNTLNWRPEREAAFSRGFTTVLLREFKKANYRATLDASAAKSNGGTPSASTAPSPESRDQILITGTVRKITLNLCYPDVVGGFSGFVAFGSWDSNGAAYIQTEWQIDLPSRRGAVHRLSTEGTSRIEEKNKGNDKVLLLDAFAVAVRNLLADQRLHSLVAGNR